MISSPGPENLTVEPELKPAVGVAWTCIMCERPKAPRTNYDRPAIRHSKLPEAPPEPSTLTLNATCEIDAVPPPERWPAVAAVALCVTQSKTAARTTPTRTSFRFTPIPLSVRRKQSSAMRERRSGISRCGASCVVQQI